MKKPSLGEFEAAVEACLGNMTDVANMLQVSRQAVYKWINSDEDFENVVKDSRKRVFDKALDTARIVAMGIPKIKNGKLVGWVERPDTKVLIYLLQTLGKDEGFGNSVDLTTGGDKLPAVINVIKSDKPIEQ